LRLRHDDPILLGPASFIPSAEASGLIGKLTDFVLDHATKWCAAWQAAGWRLTVAVNLSKACFDDLTLPDRAAALCESRHLEHDQLVFELTESTLATDTASLLDVLTRLRLKGFRLSLDDFGTGYASLEELRSLPFHELKLDKQFVQGAVHDSRSRAILESAIGLASELGLSTVAEGVESEAILQMVAGLGCQTAQGYFIGGPMPAEEIADWLTRRAADPARVFADPVSPGHDREGGATTHRNVAETRGPARDDTVVRFVHDAASPLMIVLALSEMLLSEQGLHEAHRKDMHQIYDAAQEISALIDALRPQLEGTPRRLQLA
jgi:EAL domain-containing protein (putative c-di-GMP-specific phosphodiesterase class I)